MSVLVGKDTRLLVQGITGLAGSFHAKQMLDYATQVVAGVTPCGPSWLVAPAKLQGTIFAPEEPQLIAPFSEVLDQRPTFAVIALNAPVGYLDQNTTMQVFDFKPDDRPYVPMYAFVDKTGTIRFQYAGKDALFNDEEKNTRILIEALLKK